MTFDTNSNSTQTINYNREYNFIQTCLKEIKQNFLSMENRKIAKTHAKSPRDLVTDIDLAVEKFFIQKLKENFPKDNLISEEFNPNAPLMGRTWIIDPIDGTANFSTGSVIYGSQIALIDNGTPVVGGIMLPDMNMLLLAQKGKGTFLNGERIEVKKDTPLEKSLVSIGSFSNTDKQLAKHEHKLVEEVKKDIMGIRLFGTSAYDTSSVAMGHVQSHFMYAKNLWDVIPGYMIATEAGCIVTKIDGSPFELGFPSYHFSSNQALTDYVGQIERRLIAEGI